jgi:hypothetical protein
MVLRRWLESSNAQLNNSLSCSWQRDEHTDPSYVPNHVLGHPAFQIHARSTRTIVVFSLAFCFWGLMLIAWIALRIKNVGKQQQHDTRGFCIRPEWQIARAKSPVIAVGILTHLPHLELRRSSGNTVTTDDGGLDGFIPPSGTQAINGAQSARYTVRRRRKQPKPLTTQTPRQAEDAISRHSLVESWLATNVHPVERVLALHWQAEGLQQRYLR